MSYVAIVERAAQYARSRLIHGASNVGNANGRTVARVAEARAFLLDEQPVVHGYDMILRVARAAIKNGAGNCGEHAAVAYSYLFARQIFPLDYVSLVNYDHAWIVVGRPAGTDIRRPEEWGGSAVVCDPWAGLSNRPMVVLLPDYEARYETFDVAGSGRVEKRRGAESPF